MPGLADLDLRAIYRKGRHDIPADFYLPCMARADEYWRAVGYFRSSVFVLAWPALRAFIERGGQMRILCSQVLAREDVEALDEGYDARYTFAAQQLRAQVEAMLGDDRLRDPTRILAALVADGAIDLKVALLDESHEDYEDSAGRRGIFHDKLGFFRDAWANVVVFHGSMNETWSGLAPEGNLESIYVERSWLGGTDLERIREEESDFAEMWENRYPKLSVIDFPQVARDVLVESRDEKWRESLDRILARDDAAPGLRPPSREKRTLRPHQRDGLVSWAKNGRRGILAFVTGGGKTFTALTAIREAIVEFGEPVMVVVPDQVLFEQWDREIRESLADLDLLVLRAGNGHNRWRDTLAAATRAGRRPRLVLSTLQTASSHDFMERVAGGEHLMLVVDEVHNAGATKRRVILDDGLFGPRLGLSATPERAGDPEGTQVLLDFFGGVLEPRYSLADAVRPGSNGEESVLTPYRYQPHTVVLTEDEMEAWRALSKEIAILRARAADGDSSGSLERRIRMKLLDRARIVKQAEGKVAAAASIMAAEYTPGERWLVYCDDQSQMSAVVQALGDVGIEAMPFHSKMEGSRDDTLTWLEVRGGVVVAIKCLDEGVDIPSVSHALILASSKNPREFIQRRGRVLRRSPGKAEASLHDVVVIAPRYDVDDDESASDPVLAGELARAIEFATSAANPMAGAALHSIAIDAGIDWHALIGDGIEDGEEAEA